METIRHLQGRSPPLFRFPLLVSFVRKLAPFFFCFTPPQPVLPHKILLFAFYPSKRQPQAGQSSTLFGASPPQARTRARNAKIRLTVRGNCCRCGVRCDNDVTFNFVYLIRIQDTVPPSPFFFFAGTGGREWNDFPFSLPLSHIALPLACAREREASTPCVFIIYFFPLVTPFPVGWGVVLLAFHLARRHFPPKRNKKSELRGQRERGQKGK